ncbi:rho GTPase-activating protein 19-like [Drosophila miranda]|uniref:rho GTPase-activating protein 19-like n=1 Tax=Drosophila miranda TaxID=7229 RepID=UPI00143F0D4F|nr:rho GTPase-activating protein 19-like [Drosophila miranda]
MGGQVAATAERQQHLLNSVQLLLLLLPEEHRELLQHIIKMLHSVAAREESNKMSAENLAILFTPHLICPRQMPPEALHYTAKKMSSIVSYMIQQGLEIFEVPGKLDTDIRAYFLERKRKKTMSPEQTLEESFSDDSTVNTSANNSNYTDTALAQLYAHIQSLPESSKKRRLIKQFNKQNGQGHREELQRAIREHHEKHDAKMMRAMEEAERKK